ncbi:hypothetical protein Clark_0016, partial [Mycobacterium phage Clark]
GRP